MSDAADTAGILAHGPASATENPAPKKRAGGIRWHEPSIEQQHAERGVLYGTQRIVEPNTPYRHNKADEGLPAEVLDAVTAAADVDAVVDTAWADAMPDGGADAAGLADGGWDDVPAARPAVAWDEDAAAAPKPSKFSAARAAHYNEFHALQAWRERRSSASDDSSDDAEAPAASSEAQG